MDKVYFPGFGLKPSMYSRLDLGENSSCIDLNVQTTLEGTISEIVSDTPSESIAIGYSMGARLALACALSHPGHFSGLVLISANVGIQDSTQRRERMHQDADLIEKFQNDPGRGFEALDRNEVFEQNDSDQNFLKEHRIQEPEKLTKQLQVLGLGSFDSLESQLIDLRIPVLYISGSRDQKYCEINARYKKGTPFSHHRILDSDHRVPISAPRTLGLNIDWFANNVV